ncbi:L-aminoadipate-semialdehyde dehydrogenase-phosphopantetheinyl transferase isoform X3 [Oopsacas minuta]|uniref:L-aminoadipate-semialdehyde dehydrogenase-phosphopantetheinyl transferase n=1 Tax=Oopsacas minuta TaxID=111878 RepID=A0AAV7K6G6_9METZ|nr:L-aminoadipate-semialdehyde dehydrogenase-phosphopantetheinyl transferase isoform X3 [Oopsacas minuta]
MSRYRWAFNIRLWNPTDEEWKRAISLISRTELDRISKFVFLDDRKRALVGRLSIRAAICNGLRVPWDKIELSRTSKGKPCLTEEFISKYPNASGYNFNISHQGDYVVLAAEDGSNVGIDVMKIELPRSNKTVEEFFHTMRKLFTPSEWSYINSAIDQHMKLTNFYRLWTLKESYLKATGQGISLDLQFLDFSNFSPLTLENVQTSTRVSTYLTLQYDWLFEESYIDANHIVSVAINGLSPSTMKLQVMEVSNLIHIATYEEHSS